MKVSVTIDLTKDDRKLIGSYFKSVSPDGLAASHQCQVWIKECVERELDNLPENFDSDGPA